MEKHISQWVLDNCKFAAPLGSRPAPAVSPAVEPIYTRPEAGQLPVVTTPKAKEHGLSEELGGEYGPPLAEITKQMETGIGATKEVLELAKDAQNYPSIALAFQETFQNQTIDEVAGNLLKLSVFLKRIRGKNTDPRDPRMTQEAKTKPNPRI